MDVRLQDVTNNFTALDIVGPASRDLMKNVTGKKQCHPANFHLLLIV
jgi:glycine cleavage system aminomethyltransferase T